MRLVLDPGWILTKNSVMGKVVGLLAGLSEEYRGVWAETGRTVIHPGSPKISRGENYRGLPWAILDYPRVFSRDEVLAIRTMFWWGHAFSVTLHLKGSYKELFLPVIRRRRAELAGAGFHIAVGEDEWRHELVPENYQPLQEAGESGAVSDPLLGIGDAGAPRPFLKLSAAVGLDRWGVAQGELLGLYTVLLRVLREAEGR